MSAPERHQASAHASCEPPLDAAYQDAALHELRERGFSVTVEPDGSFTVRYAIYENPGFDQDHLKGIARGQLDAILRTVANHVRWTIDRVQVT